MSEHPPRYEQSRRMFVLSGALAGVAIAMSGCSGEPTCDTYKTVEQRMSTDALRFQYPDGADGRLRYHQVYDSGSPTGYYIGTIKLYVDGELLGEVHNSARLEPFIQPDDSIVVGRGSDHPLRITSADSQSIVVACVD